MDDGKGDDFGGKEPPLFSVSEQRGPCAVYLPLGKNALYVKLEASIAIRDRGAGFHSGISEQRAGFWG